MRRRDGKGPRNDSGVDRARVVEGEAGVNGVVEIETREINSQDQQQLLV